MDFEAYFDRFTERDWQESDPDDGTVRFALVGLGHWTLDEAIPAIERSELCETTVLVSGSRAKAESVANGIDTAEAGITYEEFHDGVATDAYDAVYVCTPNATHLEHVRAGAALGKDILCEKPMEASLDRAQKLVAACTDAGVTLMVGYRMHTEPAVRRVKELIQKGFIGEPRIVHGQMSGSGIFDDPNPGENVRVDQELSGGCAMPDLGVYPLNTARFLLEADPVSVHGITASSHPVFEDVPDENVTFHLDFPGDLTGVCAASHNAQLSSHLTVTGTEGEITIQPAFYCDMETIEITLRRGTVADRRSYEQVNQMTEEFDYFADCLLTGREPYPDGRHALLDVQVIEAVYESAESGRRVDLDRPTDGSST